MECATALEGAAHLERLELQRQRQAQPERTLGQFERGRAADIRSDEAPGSLDGNLRIVTHHVHAELDRRVGDQTADLAETDDAERLARQFDAGELFLAIFDDFVEIGGIGAQRLDETHRRHQGEREASPGIPVRDSPSSG